MIVVAVLAIVAAIAYPSYLNQVRRGHRTAAQSFMMDVAMRQQQRLLDVRSYATSVSALGMTLPADVDARYTLSITASAGPPATFTLSAAPKSGQVGDSCGSMSITNAGVKSPANCW